MRTRPALTVFAAAAALSGILAGCGGSSPSTASSSAGSPAASSSSVIGKSGGAGTQPAARQMITIKNFAYTVPRSVKAGSSVMVKNTDGTAHTVTADSGHAFDVTIQAGATAHFTAPSKPGSYPFHCTFHSNMHGTLTVG